MAKSNSRELSPNAAESASDLALKVEEDHKKVVTFDCKTLKPVKKVRTVLPEDVYLRRLEDIIVKDYFPELPKLKAQKEYLNAVAMNDLSKIRELQLRYSCKRTEQRTSPSHRRSPEVFDPATPGPSTSHASIDDSIQSTVANRMGDNEKAKKRLKESDVSINQFLNNYTSEDNASFEELSELQHKREKIRNAWMYEAEKKHNEVMKAQEKQMIMVADEQLMIANAPRKDDEGAKPVGNWSYKARNTALFVPDEVPLTMNEHLQREKMNQMVINKEATRFHYETRSEPSKNSLAMAAMMQAANQAGKVDITGKEMGVVSKSTLGLVATPSPAPGKLLQ
ncbi:hypothetical protein AB6A40_001130 [Gnathostoma spinigerum]|uniref:Uncharacterized protein n=1 Tax=Gnathostoma spinigerum TaxID=75299 RepID=A0ABD6E4R0_9BILA